jgi:hypothetical protein
MCKLTIESLDEQEATKFSQCKFRLPTVIMSKVRDLEAKHIILFQK